MPARWRGTARCREHDAGAAGRSGTGTGGLRRSICQRPLRRHCQGLLGDRRQRGGVRQVVARGEHHMVQLPPPPLPAALPPIWLCESSCSPASVPWAQQSACLTLCCPGPASQCWFDQPTYTTHAWRLRDADTGALLAEYVGATATVTLLPGGVRCEPGLCRPPPADIEDPRWGAWRLRGAAAGCIPIWAFDCVCQEAVCAAEHVVEVRPGEGRGCGSWGARGWQLCGGVCGCAGQHCTVLQRSVGQLCTAPR